MESNIKLSIDGEAILSEVLRNGGSSHQPLLPTDTVMFKAYLATLMCYKKLFTHSQQAKNV